MHVTRIADADAYFPSAHRDMRCLRLQGQDAGPSDGTWIGLSHILPGGGTDMTASAREKFYVVLDGAVTIETTDGSVILLPWDSCRLAPNEQRALKNNTNRTATVLLVMT